MITPKNLLLLALAGTLPGCATIISGTTQRVAVQTQPEGATCNVMRSGVTIGTVASTPGTVKIHKGAPDLAVSCAKPGYQTSQGYDASGVDGWLFGNLLIGGILGTVVDFVSGAAYHYDSDVGVAMAAQPYSGTPYAAGQGYLAGTADSPNYHGGVPRPSPAAGTVAIMPPTSPNGDVTYAWGRGSD